MIKSNFQLLVDLRTQEIHRLRDERASHILQLEEFDQIKLQLQKTQAQVEDIKVQLDNKSEIIRDLNMTKSQLEDSLSGECRERARIARQLEELQWRIRNKGAIPQAQILSPSVEKEKEFVLEKEVNNVSCSRLVLITY